MDDMFFGATPSVFENAKQLRLRMTHAEKILWKAISNKKIKGFRFKCQHPISCYVADFYCHKARLVIELDGEVHALAEQVFYDSERTHDLKTRGLKVIRFTNLRVLQNLEEVLIEIEKHLITVSPL